VIGVSVRDNSPVNRKPRIDVKIALLAIEPLLG
jgi:hypothetical protein